MTIRNSFTRTALSVGLFFLVGGAPNVGAVPLYFEGPDAFGFSEADALAQGIDFIIDGSFSFESAGDPALGGSPLLSVTTSLVGLIGPEPMPPTFADPLVAIVEYTVTNTTGSVLDGEHLLFTLGAVDALNGGPDPFPFIEPAEFGLESDSDGLLIASSNPLFFGAILLPMMGLGDIHTFQIIHVVADDLGGTIIPTPGLALLVTPVPEPAAMLLVAMGVGALIVIARRRNELVRTRVQVSRAAVGIPSTGVSLRDGSR